MLVLHRQEKVAVVILIFVTFVCLTGTIMLDGMGKEQFSEDFHAGMTDGTLVRWEGVVGSIYNARSGSVNLDVSGVSVFIPVSAGDIPVIKAGSSIRVIGKVQHWKGKEEIIIEDGKDINLL
ncbi:MAG TPA: hypothetical protein PLG55_09250 [Methanospirillum sp.]|jgi:hypothetical protein|uniref:hypothetical protein n=1 Tax=Methanospirillum sp. TaxID=45200 RepID=UPI001BD6B62C|nr:hypothetical protein [Methanospirillum sp.]HPY60894.1 hypothetical protein [Methanospirillum sp.]